MSYTQTAEFELASSEYVDIQGTTDASTTYSEGELVAFNDCLAFCIADVAISSKFAAVMKCDRVDILKAAEAMSKGQKLYWDDTSNVATVTDTSAGLPPIGYVRLDAGASDNTVNANFDARGQNSLTVAA